MRILLRADAGGSRGTGHAMRMLTLGEELADQGHEALLCGDLGGVGWLEARVEAGPVGRVDAAPDTLDVDAIHALAPDRVVVDSYLIDPAAISALAREVLLLAVVDGDRRGIVAGLYVDPNLGSAPADRTLAGSRYALVRREFVELRRDDPAAVRREHPRIVVFMGGTDATDAITTVVASIAAAVPSAQIVPVTSAPLPDAIAPTAGLPELLAGADLVVCAAGTSAWDVCTLGVPAVLVAVVENQRAGLEAALAAGVAGGVDAVDPTALGRVGAEVARALADDTLRAGRVTRARELFDGRGAERVAAALLAL